MILLCGIVVLSTSINAYTGSEIKHLLPDRNLEAPPITSIAARLLSDPVGVQFMHMATTGNTSSSVTYIRHYATDGNPYALLFVTPDVQPGGIGSMLFPNFPVGVWYSNGQWTIYNQSLVSMPLWTTYHVLVVPAGSNAFVHTAKAGNIYDDLTYIDHPLLNNNDGALILVTPTLSPEGGSGVNNPHMIGTFYSSIEQKWSIQNLDREAMPVGAAFNVLILPNDSRSFFHLSDNQNRSGYATYLDHPALNGHPNAIPFITQNTVHGGNIYNINPRLNGVWYDTSRNQWAIVNLNQVTMPYNAPYNVLVPEIDSDAFVHYASGTNIWTDYTYFSNPLTNQRSHAILFTTANWNPGGYGGVYHNHPIGVRYADYYERWSIFNEDGVYMPTDPMFNVLIPVPDAGVFVHKVNEANNAGYQTFIDHPLTNVRSGAILIVTPNWNPGGGGGLYNNHVIGVAYDTIQMKWGIYNTPLSAMENGTAFNVLVAPSGMGNSSTTFVHTATTGNSSGHITFIDHFSTNGRPTAILYVTLNLTPAGSTGVDNPHAIGVYYDPYQEKWSIFNQDFAAMPNGAAFNVLVVGQDIYLPLVIK